MTKRVRAQVVELLRCAADIPGLATAAVMLGADMIALIDRTGLYGRAYLALADVQRQTYDSSEIYNDGPFRRDLLEAALRVEEGEWP